MGKVYAQAIILALIGLAVALTDRAVRPVPGVEAVTPATPTPGTGPKADPDVKPVAPSVAPVDTTKQPTPPAVQPVPTPGPIADIPNLDVATLPVKLELAQSYTLFTNGASFLDGRKPEEYAVGRVQGAINLRNADVQSNSPAWKEFFQNANLEDAHVVYCYGKDCHEADQLRDTLAAVGFKKVFVMTSSVEEWKAAGLPTE